MGGKEIYCEEKKEILTTIEKYRYILLSAQRSHNLVCSIVNYRVQGSGYHLSTALNVYICLIVKCMANSRVGRDD